MDWEEMMEHGVGGGDPDDEYDPIDLDEHEHDDDEFGRCEICGDRIDHCLGHGEIAEEVGRGQ